MIKAGRLGGSWRAVLAAVVLCVCACNIPGLPPPVGIGNITSDSVRDFLATMSVVYDAPCGARQGGLRISCRCRTFEAVGRETYVGLYDPITDTIIALIMVESNGQQRTIWQRDGETKRAKDKQAVSL